jgi:hypothetical protein
MPVLPDQACIRDNVRYRVGCRQLLDWTRTERPGLPHGVIKSQKMQSFIAAAVFVYFYQTRVG